MEKGLEILVENEDNDGFSREKWGSFAEGPDMQSCIQASYQGPKDHHTLPHDLTVQGRCFPWSFPSETKMDVPSGSLLYSYWKWPFADMYGGFSHQKWWSYIVFCEYLQEHRPFSWLNQEPKILLRKISQEWRYVSAGRWWGCVSLSEARCDARCCAATLRCEYNHWW